MARYGEGFYFGDESTPRGEGHARAHHNPINDAERARSAGSADAIGVSDSQLKSAASMLISHQEVSDEQYAGIFNLPFGTADDESYSVEHRRAMQRVKFLGKVANEHGQYPVIRQPVAAPAPRVAGERRRRLFDRTIGEIGRQTVQFVTSRPGIRHIRHHLKYRNYEYAEPKPQDPPPDTTVYITTKPKGTGPRSPEPPESPTEPTPSGEGPQGPQPGSPGETEQLRAASEQLRRQHDARQQAIADELRRRGEGPDDEPDDSGRPSPYM